MALILNCQDPYLAANELSITFTYSCIKECLLMEGSTRGKVKLGVSDFTEI